jgi:hypothetical protein
VAPESSGSDRLVDSDAGWPRLAHRSRTSERHRKRRRSRKAKPDIRAKIRMRMWLACAGALLVMAGALYYALGRQPGAESGGRLDPRPAVVETA